MEEQTWRDPESTAHERLGLEPGHTQHERLQAVRRAITRWHPDKGGDATIFQMVIKTRGEIQNDQRRLLDAERTAERQARRAPAPTAVPHAAPHQAASRDARSHETPQSSAERRRAHDEERSRHRQNAERIRSTWQESDRQAASSGTHDPPPHDSPPDSSSASSGARGPHLQAGTPRSPAPEGPWSWQEEQRRREKRSIDERFDEAVEYAAQQAIRQTQRYLSGRKNQARAAGQPGQRATKRTPAATRQGPPRQARSTKLTSWLRPTAVLICAALIAAALQGLRPAPQQPAAGQINAETAPAGQAAAEEARATSTVACSPTEEPRLPALLAQRDELTWGVSRKRDEITQHKAALLKRQAQIEQATSLQAQQALSSLAAREKAALDTALGQLDQAQGALDALSKNLRSIGCTVGTQGTPTTRAASATPERRPGHSTNQATAHHAHPRQQAPM